LAGKLVMSITLFTMNRFWRSPSAVFAVHNHPNSANPQSKPIFAKAATLKTGTPLIRFFRGFRKAELTPSQYITDLQNRFIPAAPATHAKNGLVAYFPAVPSAQKPASIPDELAVIMYENDAVYQAAKSTPEGKWYSDLHREVFDKERSKSGSAVPFPGVMQFDQPYDVLGRATDWQAGVSTLFVGARKSDVTADTFLAGVSKRVADSKVHFEKAGLEGYLVVAGPDYFVEYQNWSGSAAQRQAKPAATPDVLMTPVLDQQATVFNGKIAWGQAVNAKFPRRSPND
jgi:hypothetical protein